MHFQGGQMMGRAAPFFFWGKDCVGVPHSNFINSKKLQRNYLQKGGGEYTKKQQLYVIDSSHWIRLMRLSSLTLMSWRCTWSENFLNQRLKETEPLSKILEFLIFQISHTVKTKISMMQGSPVEPIMCNTRSWMLSDTSHWMLSLFQQDRANGQVKKRWFRSSTSCVEQRTHQEFGCTL